MNRISAGLRTTWGPLFSAALLVAGVRLVDAGWVRVTGRRPPLDVPAAPRRSRRRGRAPLDADEAAAPQVLRDRLIYATLLALVGRLARRFEVNGRR